MFILIIKYKRACYNDGRGFYIHVMKTYGNAKVDYMALGEA